MKKKDIIQLVKKAINEYVSKKKFSLKILNSRFAEITQL